MFRASQSWGKKKGSNGKGGQRTTPRLCHSTTINTIPGGHLFCGRGTFYIIILCQYAVPDRRDQFDQYNISEWRSLSYMSRLNLKNRYTIFSMLVISTIIVTGFVSVALPALYARALPVQPRFNHFLSTHYDG